MPFAPVRCPAGPILHAADGAPVGKPLSALRAIPAKSPWKITANLFINRKGVQARPGLFLPSSTWDGGTHMPYHPPRSYIRKVCPPLCWRTGKPRTFYSDSDGDVYGWLAPLTGALDDHQKQTLDGNVRCRSGLPGMPCSVSSFDRLKQSRTPRQYPWSSSVRTDHGEHLGEKQFMGHSPLYL